MRGFFRPPCSVCGKPSAKIEIVPPNELPEEFACWAIEKQEDYRKYRDMAHFYLTYSGPGGGNGSIGHSVEPTIADTIVKAFSGPPTNESIRSADFYDNAGFCLECSAFYCSNHWNIGDSGSGTCPSGHWASLDPHWSPD